MIVIDIAMVAIFCAYVFVPTHIFWSVLFWCLPSCCQLWVAYCFSAHICESGVFVPTIWFLILLYPLFCCLRIPAHLKVRDGFVPTYPLVEHVFVTTFLCGKFLCLPLWVRMFRQGLAVRSVGHVLVRADGIIVCRKSKIYP